MTTAGARQPGMTGERYRERLAGTQLAVRNHGLRGLLIAVGPDLRYLTGYNAIPTERLTMLVLPADGAPRLVVPRLEATPARRSAAVDAGLLEVVTWGETDDPHRLVGSLLGEGHDVLLPLGVSDRLWAGHLLRLQDGLAQAHFESATPVLRELRVIKDDDEIELLRIAAHAADRVVERIASGHLVGRTESDVAHEVRDRLVAEGHDSADFAIVASGPNAASPHHEASDRVIGVGEPIVLDIGGSLGGYRSDTTRTLWVTGGEPSRRPDDEFLRIFGLVRDAQAEATSAVRPGVPCERLDEIARSVIEGGGLGPQFIHRLGHGIGLEGHEEPYLVAGRSEPLQVGMAFSIEPGIYLEGHYGVRIEDIVVCGPDGPIVLNESPRDLRIVDG
jgi:Xaa-Pro aminopeptidase